MKLTEEQLQMKLEEINRELDEARRQLKACKSSLSSAEDNFISLKLHQERLVEELRVIDSSKVKVEVCHNQLDIERFKLALPELFEKIK